MGIWTSCWDFKQRQLGEVLYHYIGEKSDPGDIWIENIEAAEMEAKFLIASNSGKQMMNKTGRLQLGDMRLFNKRQ